MLIARTPVLKKHQGRYNVIFYDPDTQARKWHALGTDKKTVAQQRYRKIVQAYESGAFNPFESKYQLGALTLRIAADRFLASEKAKWAPRTYRDYDTFLTMMIAMLPKGLRLIDVAPRHASTVMMRPPSPSTRAGYRRRMNRFFRWCLSEGLIKTNPAHGLARPKKPKTPPAYLTRDEHSKLIRSIESAAHQSGTKADYLLRLARVCRFGVATGLRLRELLTLSWSSVDYYAMRLHVVGKGNKGRMVPLFDEAAAVLREIESDHARQFGASPPKTLEVFAGLSYYDTSHDISDFLTRTNLKYKAPHKSTHLLRSTFASWCVMAGVDIYVVSQWLGHSSVVITQESYAYLSPDYVPENARKAFAAKRHAGT